MVHRDGPAYAIAKAFAEKYDAQKALLNDCNELMQQIVDTACAAVGDEIKLADGRALVVIDNFANGNTQWRPALMRRIDLQFRK